MEWIDTTHFARILHLFHDRYITAYWSEDGRTTKHIWSCHDHTFSHRWDGHTEQLSEDTLLVHYGKHQWHPEHFFYLRDEREKTLAVRIAEHLVETGCLNRIIGETDIQFARQCACCGHIFDQGWMDASGDCYCSEECLLKGNPGYTLDELLQEDADGHTDTFWTEWHD